MNTTYETKAILPVESYLPKVNPYQQNKKNPVDISKQAHQELKELRHLNTFMEKSDNLHNVLALPVKKLNMMRVYYQNTLVPLSEGVSERTAVKANFIRMHAKNSLLPILTGKE
ncbi:MAG: hypothetical protein LBI53_03620 [Candidatus Peribacteria bacterium]|jgi:hypothetical protein|nr:hypothetical protein [Candidatus Peribacteria bacterium]